MKAFMKLRYLLTLLTAFCLVACEPSTPSDDVNQSNTNTVEASSQHMAISFVGFFNSERRDFNPSIIGYAGIDYEVAINAMKVRAEGIGYDVAPLGEVDAKVVAITPEDELTASVDTMLAAINDWLQTTDESCARCKTLSGVKVNAVEDYKNWGSNDKMIFIWGLETLAPNSLGLRSGLGAFIFDANGEYKKHIFKEYNFSNYATEPFKADLEAIMDEIGR